MNKAILLGRLTKDPELRYTANGIAVATFDLAINGKKRQDGSNEADFLPIVAWRERAEFAAQHLSKGRQVLVEGQIKTRSYDDKEGVRRKATEIVASLIYFADSKRDTSNDDSDLSFDSGFTPVDPDDDDLPF